MQPIDTAMAFFAMGVATIPINPREKQPSLSSWKPYQTQLPTPSDLLSWFTVPHNIGVVTGWRGLTVLDFDALNVYHQWLQWCGRHDKYSIASKVAWSAYRVSTSRGVHVYLWLTTPERGNRKLPGIDIKSRGGYVLGEGSIHPTGAEYRALQPGIIIPTVDALSEVLPPALLATTEQPDNVRVLRTLVPLSNDPWVSAAQPAQSNLNLVDHIRKTLHLEDILSDLQKTGHHHYLTRCPLHDDGSPSMWLDTQKQICGCFAGCTDKPLDVINLYARLYGLSNTDAIHALARIV